MKFGLGHSMSTAQRYLNLSMNTQNSIPYRKETKEGNEKVSDAIEKVLKRTESRMRIAHARDAVNARLCSKRRAVEVFQLTPEEAAEFLAE